MHRLVFCVQRTRKLSQVEKKLVVKFEQAQISRKPRQVIVSRRSNEAQAKTCDDFSFDQGLTSGEIACPDWLRRVTCQSVIFRIGLVEITGFVSHGACLQRNNGKETLKSRKNLTNLVN